MTEDNNMNNNLNISGNLDPEVLETLKAMSTPDSPEFEQLQQFWNKFGAEGMLEFHRAHDECPVDAFIAHLKSGSDPKKMGKWVMSALARSEVYLAFIDDREVCSLNAPGGGLVVMVFTRPCHGERFAKEYHFMKLTIRKAKLRDLFLVMVPGKSFSMHVNPEPNNGMFQINFKKDMVDYMYNLAIYDDDEILRHWTETGNNPYQSRY